MGLAAVAAAIVLSACAGVAARRRLGEPAEHDAARLLKAMLFGAMPFVTFFNVAHVEFDSDVLGGVVIGWAALACAATLALVAGAGHAPAGRRPARRCSARCSRTPATSATRW